MTSLESSSVRFQSQAVRSAAVSHSGRWAETHQKIAVRDSLRVVVRSSPRTEALEWFTRQDAPRSMRQVIWWAAARTGLGRRHKSNMTTFMVACHGGHEDMALAECRATGRTVAPGGRPNHRVEVNRHQPSCLPGRLDSMIASFHSNLHGQVAVTHPGRWPTKRR